MPAKPLGQLAFEQREEPVQPTDQADRRGVEVGTLPGPLLQDRVHVVRLHVFTISSSEGILVSMETTSWRAVLITAFAPAAWGTTYLVTERLLPPDRPLLS